MRHLVLSLCLTVSSTLALPAWAADSAVKTGDFHNVHIRVPDPAKAGEWYVKYMGATTGRAPQLVYFGKTLIEFVKDDSAKPSAGSVIDHIGLSYADLDARMKEIAASGAKIQSAPRDVPGLFKLGFIEDPWGTRIEVVQDPELLGLHHLEQSLLPTATGVYIDRVKIWRHRKGPKGT